MTPRRDYIITDPPAAQFLFGSTKTAWFWLLVRLYVGWTWLEAGWSKVHDAAWVGGNAGTALAGFVRGALAKTAGAHPDVQGWYAWFLQHMVLPHTSTWGPFVAWGELLVGIALIAGVLTGIAAFFGAFMNLNYLMAGTVSVNPVLGILALGLVMAWKVAGYYGADSWLLPYLGTPWHPGRVFQESRRKP